MAKSSRLRVLLSDYPALESPGGTAFLRESLVWLVRGKKVVRAFSARCPHKPKKGRVRYDSERCRFHCPLHDWTFTLKGKARGKAKRPLWRLTAWREGPELVIELP